MDKFFQEHAKKVYWRFAVKDNPYENTPFIAASIPLKNGYKEVFLYFNEPGRCGTSGCALYILEEKNLSYKFLDKIAATWNPIRLLPNETNGYPDVTVVVAGGGIIPGYNALLQFNGHTYPNNPSIPPAKKLKDKPEGKILISFNKDGELENGQKFIFTMYPKF